MNKNYIINKFLNFSQKRVLPKISKTLEGCRRRSFQNIGAARLPKNAPKALVINISTAIPYYLEGDIYKCPILDNHALFWEAAELVRQLNERGFIIDFIDCNDNGIPIEWQKYQLIFDERNNLMFAPQIEGQKKIFYSTGLKWSFHNDQELKRIGWFYDRTEIRVNPERFLFPNYSDEFAVFQTYYGKSEFMNMFSAQSKKIPLQVSCTHIPTSFNKKKDSKKFVWFGGSGSIHKGLDLTVEAFKLMPENELLIFGPAERETSFFYWLKQAMSKHPNIQYYGYGDLKNEKQAALLNSSVANIFPSCSEGGPGSVAQMAFFGLIPIVTRTANIRYEHLGYVLEDGSSENLIKSIIERVKYINDLREPEILHKTEAIYEYANRYHTREAYRMSITNLLNELL